MKTTKKALSVLLAVIMIMSSMSVCFGSISFAADNTNAVNAFVSAMQCDAMKSFPALSKVETNNGKSGADKITYKTFTYTAPSYAYYEQVVNVITKLDAAIKGLDEYTNGETHNDAGSCEDGYDGSASYKRNKCTDLGWIEKHLKLAIGDSRLATLNGTYNLANLFAAVFNMDGVSYRNADGTDDGDYTTTKKNVNASIHNILVVKATTAKDKLKSYDSISSIPDTLKSEYQYKLSMCRETQHYQKKTLWWTDDKYDGYHYAIRSGNPDGKINTPAATDATISTNKSVLTTAQSTLNSYSNYLNAADVNAVLAISTDATTLTNAYDAINTQRNNVVNNFDQATLTKFFPKVDTALKNIADAIEFLAFNEIVTTINTLYGTDFSRMNKTEVLAHLTAFRAAWAEFTKLEQATQDLIVATYGLDVDAIETRIQEVSDRYDALCIAEEKVRINTHIDMYNDWTIDDVDNGNVTTQQLATAVATLYTDMQFLSKYNQELVAAVCGATYMSDLTALYNHNVYLAEGSKMNDSYLAKWQAFINEVQPATADSLDPATLLEGLKNYDAWTTELKNLIAEMKDYLGEENANKLYDEVNAVMTDYMDAAYTALNATVETQINTAYDLFVAFKNTYGKEINFTSVSAYNYMKTSIGRIDVDAYEFLKVAQSIRISQDAINKYNALQEEFPDYQTFLDTFGFSEYAQSTMPDITRPASDDDVAREGTYTTKDADIEKIITKLDALLNNAEVQKLLGQLLNKNEDGTWNGKSFDLGAMLTDLIKGALFTDDMINTIIGMLYPLVVTEFIKVWANDLPPTFHLDKVSLIGSVGIGAQDATVRYDKNLYTILKESEFYIFPDHFATQLNSTKYAENIKLLNKAASDFKTEFGATNNDYYTLKYIDEYKDDGTQKKAAEYTPWDSAVLKKDVIDEETGEVVLNDDGTPKTEWALDWGVDAYKESLLEDGEFSAEDQVAFDNFFYQAFDDAAEGLKPLLLALLANQSWSNTDVKDMASVTINDVSVLGSVDVTVDLDLGATANRGYANLLIPVYEALGLSKKSGDFKSAETVEGYATNANAAADILKAILDPIFLFAKNLSAQPLTTILNILPNVAYALITDMVPELLSMLKTNITYFGTVFVDRDAWLIGGMNLTEKVSAAKVEGKADIDVGTMLDLKSLGVDLSDGLNTLLPGFGLNIPNIDQGKLATMGTLGQINTGRAEAIYTQPAAGKAYHINANKADVLLFLLEYALGSGLLGQFITVPEEEGLVRDLLTNLMNPENTDNVIAALVELLNAKAYNTLENYEWYHGYIDNVEVGTITDPAVQVYLNPENDWTEAKAKYLYDNIDAIVGAILKMANVDLDDTTEEVDGSIGKLIGGIFSAKTLTSIARLLGSISDINALIEGIGAETEETETPDASEPETVEEGEDATEGEEDENGATAAPAIDIDVNALIKEFLGVDLKTAFGKYAEIPTVEENPDYIYDFGKEIKTASDFAAVLSEMLAPLNPVLGFILDGKNLTLTIKEAVKDETGAVVTPAETVELIGYNGYDSAIVPLLEALGCDAKAYENGKALELTLTALATKIDALISGKTIKGIIDILPGLFYFLAGNNLSTVVRNLLQPVYVILDTIRPIINVDLAGLLAGIEINGAPLGLDLDILNLNFVFDLIKKFIPAEIDLGTLLDDVKELIYSICKIVGKEYKSVSALAGQTTWKRGEYGEFSQADLLTVVLSFVLEWAKVPANAAKLDELLKTNGLISSITTVLDGADIGYTAPDWMYWFETEEEFNDYVNGEKALPNTLAALTYPNDWNEETAQYLADNLASLVDMVIALINKDKEDAPKTLAALLSDLLGGLVNADKMNDLVGMIAGLLENVDDTLLDVAGYILGDSSTEKKEIDIVGLKNYTCTAEINSLSDFINELANVLDTYASGIVNWLFFGDDFRFAKESDKTDTIVINGGNGYANGLAMILEALGCELPAEPTTKSALGALAARVEALFDDTDGKLLVDEVLELLPNLVYFLNANGAGAAVSNILAPVVALINALKIEGFKLDLADLIKIKKDDGTEVKLNLGALTLANIVNFVESLTGLNLTAVENILVDFCVGKIEKGTHIYKMTADKADVVTIVLTTALLVLKNEQNADVIGVDAIAALDEVFNSAPVTYVTPNWDYCWDENDIDYVYGTIGVIESALNYPNDWTEETSQYVAANLSKLVDMVIGLIEIDGTKYESLAALIDAKLNIYTDDNLKAIQTALGDLIGGLDGDLKNIVDVALGAADSLLGADVNGLLNYNVEGADGKEAFVNALTGMLMEVEGLVDWLLLGEDYELFVDDDGDMVYEDGEAIITLNGGHGYAEGLALLLEALGCEDLPTVYDKNTIDTEATVKAVLTSLANRIDEVLDKPVDEVIDLLPNLIYFLNTNGVAAVIDNLIGAINALLIKLEGVGLEVNINDLVNIKELMGIEGTDAAISLDNLAMKDILQAVSLMTGLDLIVLEGTLNGFALGNVQAYPSVSRTGATFKMQYEDAFDKADMITVLVTAVLNVLETGDNAEKIDEMANTNLVSAIRDVFMGGTVVYTAPNWDYTNDTKYEVKYPNNWTVATAEYVADNLVEIGDMIAGLIDANYATLGELLTDKVNVFTTDNLDKLVELINNLLGDIDATLIEGAGLLLGAKLVGDDSLATYKAPAGIDTAEEFAAELANVLSTYAPGVVEWLFLGESYKFFVNDANGDDEFNNGKYTEGEDAITINGAQGYAEGLALLLEALGCEDLPAVYDAEGNALELDTADTIEAVLVSLGKRIDYILTNPVVEVVNLLPNLFYFLNTNGVAAIVDNLTAGITALLGKLEAFGVALDINELVNLKKLMGLEDTDATISLDNLAMKDILQAVSLMVGIDLTYIEKVLVNFNLGEVAAYDSVSQYAGETKKMTYVTTFEDHDMITVIANLLLITLADAKNEAVIKELLGADIYAVIIDVLNLETAEAPIQYMDWKATDRVGDTFNALETSPTYKGFEYGPLYTEEMAQYIADNIGEFINNIIYLLGLEINGVNVESLEELLSGLIGGSLYNSDIVITIRDAIAGLASGIEGLEVNGKVVGNHIVEILKTAEIADLKKVANINVPEFSDDKAQFIASLCDVLKPLYPVLTWLLADTDLAFFVDTDMSDFITLPGAEGYRNGIALLLEAIGCEPTALAKGAEGEALVKAILNPLLTRLDEILANPAEEILAVLTNVIYFINSNGVDVVIKNTLNAVYTVLAAIEPIAKVDLYKLVGLDAYVTLSAEELINMLLSKLEVAGFDFTAISVDLFSELTIGKLESYTSIADQNKDGGKTAYKMVYDAENANEADMVTAVMRLVITFILTENNREVLIDLLKDALGMSADAEKYVSALLKAFADSIVGKKGEDLRLGMDSVLATIYYIFYGLDTGVDNTVDGKKDLDKLWAAKIKELNDNSPSENTQVGDLITDIFDILFNDLDEEGNFPVGGGNDVADKEEIAPNGFIAFFQRIAKFFEEIGEFFRNLFSFGK